MSEPKKDPDAIGCVGAVWVFLMVGILFYAAMTISLDHMNRIRELEIKAGIPKHPSSPWPWGADSPWQRKPKEPPP
jgi:hypothetical protein